MKHGEILTTGRDKCPFQINGIFLRESSTSSSLFAKSLNDYRLTLIFFWQMIGLRRAQLYVRVRTGPFQGMPARISGRSVRKADVCETSRGQLNTLRDTTPLLASPFTLKPVTSVPRTLNQSPNRGS